MTEEERGLIDYFGELLEAKVKASEIVICSRVTDLEKKIDETKVVVDTHVEWHNSLNRKIVGNTFKYGLIVFIVVILVVIALGVKDGMIPTAIAKMIG